jgi:hypothetical protein
MTWVAKKLSVINHSNSTTARAMALMKLKIMLYRLQLGYIKHREKSLLKKQLPPD